MKCEFCKEEIGTDYNFSEYAYTYKIYLQDIQKYNKIYFCSWTCYRRYLNERNRQDKLNNLPKEVH